ncbi:MAG: DUF1175 family protein [Candidatus Accumulibacter sp.]|nr:DUF1175 family protein [Accumulibacter sp.]
MNLDPPRRRFCRTFAALGAASMAGLAVPAWALPPALPGAKNSAPPLRLDAAQSRALRAWIVRIAEEQIRWGPTPRWTQRDCAGLVRFAVAEALIEHDARWRRAMGIDGRLPPDLVPEEARRALRNVWKRPDGSAGAYVNAIGLVQENSLARGRDMRLARQADLLFFDQGQEQHLMLWTGRRIVYHNGAAPRPDDNGLRAVSLAALLHWNDTRWRPEAGNPNFAGVFSLAFLT